MENNAIILYADFFNLIVNTIDNWPDLRAFKGVSRATYAAVMLQLVKHSDILKKWHDSLPGLRWSWDEIMYKSPINFDIVKNWIADADNNVDFDADGNVTYSDDEAENDEAGNNDSWDNYRDNYNNYRMLQ